jgi:sporulation integral membrane protein YtvI
MTDDFFAWLERTFETIPFFSDNNIIERLRVHLNTEISNMITQLVSVERIQSFVTSIITTIPRIFVYTLITIVSTFYIALDFQNINRSVALQIPPRVRNIMIDIKSRFLEAIYKYIRAYFTIFMITYSELTAGFLIIGIRYAFVISFLVALVDIIPVLGTGTILIPWGIISIIRQDYFTGFALLILYAVITVIRNIIEPKIVGASIGLYPVVTLIAMFVGFNIIGIPGLFLFPITILMLKNLNDEGKIHIWKYVKKENPEEKPKEKSKEKSKEKKKRRWLIK